MVSGVGGVVVVTVIVPLQGVAIGNVRCGDRARVLDMLPLAIDRNQANHVQADQHIT